MGIFTVNPTLPSLSAVDAPVIGNTIVESSLFPIVNGVPGVPTFPGGSLNEGSTISLSVFGKFSNKASGPGTITLRAKLGGALVWTSGALPFPASLKTDNTFVLDVDLMVRAGSKVMSGGTLLSSIGLLMLPATNPVDSAALDLSIDRDLDITAQFSVADPGNKIQALGMQLVY